MREKGTIPPNMGGCWYCHNDDTPINFCNEFDTNIHVKCIQEHVEAVLNTYDPEAEIIFREFMNERVL